MPGNVLGSLNACAESWPNERHVFCQLHVPVILTSKDEAVT